MLQPVHESRFTRRLFHQLSIASIISAMALSPQWTFAEDPSADQYGGFKIGLQSYSLRHFDEETALKQSEKLGVHYWEAFPGHIPISTVPGYVAEQQAKLARSKVQLVGYGVIGFDANEAKAREYFDFAKAMGIQYISADPNKDAATFDLLDKLVEEYQIAIAIHNHGPGHRYDKASDVLEMVEGRHPLIGACVDTGHFLRSDEDPVAVVQKLGKRVFGIHLKDVRTIRDAEGKSVNKQFTILGEGDLNVVGLLRELRKQGYDQTLSMEYEENPENPLSDLELCLVAVRNAVDLIDQRDEDGFVSLFDGKSFDGWKINESPESWAIEEGAFVAKGPRSHLFYVGDEKPFKNFQLRVDVKAAPNSNGGIYVHTQYQDEGWPDYGFETQVNNTYNSDPRKTGSIYAVQDQHQQLIQDNTWWTQEVTVNGRHVVVKVDGKVAADYTEPEDFVPDANWLHRRVGSGTFCLQAHDPHSVVHFKNIRVKRLPE